MKEALEKLRAELAARATAYDLARAWPEESLNHLTSAGVWKWVIPRQYGGEQLDPIEHLHRYEAIAAGCMSTLLILANRDGACELIAASENEALKNELLPKLAANEIMTTVGIAQLTTSHQTGPPALVAALEGDGLRLRGFIPWVTSAGKCQIIVAGAVLEDRRQVLAVVPTNLPGLTVEPPLKLMALEGTMTSEVRCDNVWVEPRFVLGGPAEKVLATRSGIKPALVACSGVGLAGTMVDLIRADAERSGDRLLEIAGELATRHQKVRDRVYEFAASESAQTAEKEKSTVRTLVNDLLMRLSVAVFAYSKGSGFLRHRDAQRLVREAMFFLVWSASEDVRIGTLGRFLSS